ncbi:polysialyltransferase family glycosyltransferase [Pantoea sp. PNT03]|jgi:hypothetical protein|uniref:polysialyltransferase family glycosyltransferase n=1 Tax=Pantoea sp. PNT03 TaxID=2769258 RepID=UPI001780CD13|nr:polysialyltransferase family glycosyltransferase [Pantoea sp. PNT03]MBD9658337.1 hypothetical protein [Pantoea sp. PNT03]
MKKRLFISTGFYSSLLASVLAESSCGEIYENHLLITIDRQNIESNKIWAFRLHHWESIDFVGHEQYYNEKIDYHHNIPFFDEVFSPFPEMLLTVTSAFPADRHFFYEEGLTSYYQFLNKQYLPEAKFFCLHPFIYNDFHDLISIPISIEKVRDKLQCLVRCYIPPSLEGTNNVVIIGHGGFPDENSNRIIRDEYIDIIKRKSKQGYNVVLLAHTRYPIDDELLNRLKYDLSINFNFIYSDAPISDLFLIKNSHKIKYIAGIYSTLLVNSKVICGINTFIFDSAALSERQRALFEVQSCLLK